MEEIVTLQSLHSFKCPPFITLLCVRANSVSLESDVFSLSCQVWLWMKPQQRCHHRLVGPMLSHVNYQQWTAMKYDHMQSGRWEVHIGIQNIMAQLIVGNGIPKNSIERLLENCSIYTRKLSNLEPKAWSVSPEEWKGRQTLLDLCWYSAWELWINWRRVAPSAVADLPTVSHYPKGSMTLVWWGGSMKPRCHKQLLLESDPPFEAVFPSVLRA